MKDGFENDVRRLVRRVLSNEGIRQVSLAAALTTLSDSVSKQQISMWLSGRAGLGRARFDRLVIWLKQNGYEIIVPETKKEEGNE